jgi:hypothetical protein
MQATISAIQANLEYLNRITGSPATPYTRGADGKLTANVGNFHLYRAYGGYSIHRMANESGGITNPCGHGVFSKREVFDRLTNFIAGIEFQQRAEREAREAAPKTRLAIITEYHGATDTRGARIVAKCNGKRVSISYPYELSGSETHKAAAVAYCEKHGIKSREFTEAYTGNGYVFSVAG